MKDAPTDVGIETNPGDPARPIIGVALPMLGLVGFVDHNWSEKFSSSIGYSRLDITNSDGQLASAFSSGQYIVGNLMSYPVKNAMAGIEVQYGDRANFDDGYTSSILKVQFSFKYNFAEVFYRK